MDVRLTAEQQQLRDAAAKLSDDLGPGSVQDLADDGRIGKLDKQIQQTGWRSLRSDEASAVEVAIVAEEFGRGLVDAPFLGPVLADDLARRVGDDGSGSTIAIGGRAIDARGYRRALTLGGTTVSGSDVGTPLENRDLTRASAELTGNPTALGDLDSDAAQRWLALALATTSADLVGAARGAQTLAVAHLRAESLALIEGAVSIARHAAWAVDELDPAEAIRAGQFAKVYCARAARTVCETAIQVHGGIGNTWECLAHVYLRRALLATDTLGGPGAMLERVLVAHG